MKRSLLLMVLPAVLLSLSSQPLPSGPFRIKTIVIDAGHGGKDPGCHGVSAKEKHIALAIALKLGGYIKANFPDINIVYTRSTDVFIELHERANIANRSKADLFISIHCNANTSTQPYGTETYVMGLHKSTDNLLVSKRENASILFEDDYSAHYDGFDPNSPEAHIMFNLFQNAHLTQSIGFASRVQKEFADGVKRKDRGIHQAGFLVLYKTTMPAVLIETGFLTNHTEEKFLNSKDGQDHLASAIFRAFRSYKSEMEGTPEAGAEVSKAPGEEILIPATLPAVADSVDTAAGDQPLSASTAIIAPSVPEKDTLKPIPLPPPATPLSAVEFRVQFLASSALLAKDDARLKGIGNITTLEAGGLVKYMSGSFKKVDDAYALQARLRETGFKEAFVIALRDGVRVPVKEAIQGNQ